MSATTYQYKQIETNKYTAYLSPNRQAPVLRKKEQFTTSLKKTKAIPESNEHHYIFQKWRNLIVFSYARHLFCSIIRWCNRIVKTILQGKKYKKEIKKSDIYTTHQINTFLLLNSVQVLGQLCQSNNKVHLLMSFEIKTSIGSLQQQL